MFKHRKHLLEDYLAEGMPQFISSGLNSQTRQSVNFENEYAERGEEVKQGDKQRIHPEDSASQADYSSLRNSNEFGMQKANQIRDFRTSSLPQINEQTLENFQKQSLDQKSNRSNSSRKMYEDSPVIRTKGQHTDLDLNARFLSAERSPVAQSNATRQS